VLFDWMAQRQLQVHPVLVAARIIFLSPTADVARCLQGGSGRCILLVTSDFHTRRALSIFNRTLPGNYSVAAAFDEREFGVQWWRHRQWAKVNFDEWVKLIWWELFDRWR